VATCEQKATFFWPFFARNGFVRLHDPLRLRPYLTAMMSDLGDLGSNAYVGIAELSMHQQTLPPGMISAHYHVFCLHRFFCNRHKAIYDTSLDMFLMS